MSRNTSVSCEGASGVRTGSGGTEEFSHQPGSRLPDTPPIGRYAWLKTLDYQGRLAAGHPDNEAMVQQVAVLEGIPYSLDMIAPTSPTMEVYIVDSSNPSKGVEWPL